jgi:type IV pilus assembly protein PilC
MEFTYSAITKTGQRQAGVIQAPSLTAAGHLLKEQGLLPTTMDEKKSAESFDFLKNFAPINLREKITFIENLSIMLRSGIPVSRCLTILVKQTKNARFKNILSIVANQVEAGKGLGEALAEYPKVFSNIFVSMIKVGEMSGNLDKSLEYLGTQLQREADLKSKVKGAMMYPAVILVAIAIIGVLMSIFVLPNLTSMFKDMPGANLPVMTKIIIAISDFMSSHAIIAIGGMIGAVFLVVTLYKTPPGKRVTHIAMVHMPVISPIVKKINLARFSRILSSLLKSGISIVESLQVVSDSISNIPYKELVAKTSVDVKLGKPLTEALQKEPGLFPDLVIQMIEVGEESGSLESILEQLAAHYEEDVDSTMKNLSSIIEPLLLLVIGGVVGVLAVALISPIYNISQNIN